MCVGVCRPQAYQMRPSIIFFDEIDGLAPVRSSRQDQIHRSEQSAANMQKYLFDLGPFLPLCLLPVSGRLKWVPLVREHRGFSPWISCSAADTDSFWIFGSWNFKGRVVQFFYLFLSVLQLHRVNAPGSDGRVGQSRWGCGDRSDKPARLHRPGAATARALRQRVPLRTAWQRGICLIIPDHALCNIVLRKPSQIQTIYTLHNTFSFPCPSVQNILIWCCRLEPRWIFLFYLHFCPHFLSFWCKTVV